VSVLFLTTQNHYEHIRQQVETDHPHNTVYDAVSKFYLLVVAVEYQEIPANLYVLLRYVFLFVVFLIFSDAKTKMNKTASIEWLDFNELLLGMYSL
jgi:hypothetical protein